MTIQKYQHCYIWSGALYFWNDDTENDPLIIEISNEELIDLKDTMNECFYLKKGLQKYERSHTEINGRNETGTDSL